jgi:hypothetical protein
VVGLIVSCAVLAAAIAPVALLVAWLSAGRLTELTLASAAVGGGVCWLSGSLALTATYIAQQLQAPIQGVLLGMLFRMALPLAALVALRQQGGPLVEAGVTHVILGVYLVALVVETLLSLRMVPKQARLTKAI